MKVVHHSRFSEVYARDPAAAAQRLAPTVRALRERYELVEPEPASRKTIALVHEARHIDDVERDRKAFDMALLAAGGALTAARIAQRAEAAFALVRPPGHHASPGSCWGFCYFNNVAIALESLIREGLARSALVLDIDLHFGDGTEAFFKGRTDVTYCHPEGSTRHAWLDACREAIELRAPAADVIAISAGFDRHAEDWGELLWTEDYAAVGEWVREAAREHCGGRRFAVLEGGYNPDSMAEAAAALASALEG